MQENAILTAEAESLRRRIKAMQGTIEQLSARNSELIAEKALGQWAPKDGSPDANECSLTSLVQVRTNICINIFKRLVYITILYKTYERRLKKRISKARGTRRVSS